MGWRMATIASARPWASAAKVAGPSNVDVAARERNRSRLNNSTKVLILETWVHFLVRNQEQRLLPLRWRDDGARRAVVRD
jgi:hypothetical protein